MAGDAGYPTVDFFVSYTPADERWALWIAWTLERAGYRTMIQAWDFVPGSSFIEFMDRGVREAAAVIAVLSPSYLRSTYCRMEWQAALRSSPHEPERKLIPVRVAECVLEGLLATITYLDLLGLSSEPAARGQLLGRVREALAGRAPAAGAPGFPAGPGPVTVPVQAGSAAEPDAGQATDPGGAVAPGAGQSPSPTRTPVRRRPVVPPAYPPVFGAGTGRDVLSVLHLTGPRFGRGLVAPGEPSEPDEWQARVVTWVTTALMAGAPEPDALLISGDLTDTGSPRQVDAALRFLAGLRSQLGLEPGRVALVPGPHDVSTAACRAYFADCEADDVAPRAPYWPKWRHFAGLFRELYQGMDGLIFDADQPWTLFELPDLRLVVAGFNSTMAISHRRDDNHGLIGDVQAAYFARTLLGYERDGWLRLGLVAHALPAQEQSARRKVSGPGQLRDADLFGRLLGGLNLVLHGTPEPGADLGWLPGQVPLLPPGAPGGIQLLALDAEGLVRWTADRSGRAVPARHPVPWRSVGTTFRSYAVGSGPGLPAGPDAEGSDQGDPVEPRPVPDDPQLDLLDRVAQVCMVRLDRARVRWVGTQDPHLRVTYADSGFVSTLLIGALAGPDPMEQLDRLVRRVHAAMPNDPMDVVHDQPEGPVLTALRDAAARAGVRLRSLSDFQGLPDLGGFVAGQTERLARDPAYPAGQYVPQRFHSVAAKAEPVRADLVGELLRLVGEPDGRFVLLLGDFGFGKTFALRELTRRLADTAGAPLPILIDLRALDRAHSVDGLVAAHLANHGDTVIDLRSFRYLLRQGRIVLIFDGFDELVSRISYDQAADHLERLVAAAQDSAKIIVASRTQHFRSREQVLTALGERVGLLPQRRILQLEEFDPAQIEDFLAQVYGDRDRAQRRGRIMGQISDLSGLAANPRMLAFLARLSEERLAPLAQGRQALSAARLYREIIDYWLDFEAGRAARAAGAPPGLDAAALLDAVTQLAVRLWQRGEVYLRPGDVREVAKTLTYVAVPMTGEETEHALGSGSLLTRTDEGLFGFIHFSVCEWLVAEHIAAELAEGRDELLRYQRLTGLVVDFLCTLASAERLDSWVHAAAERRAAEPAAGSVQAPVDAGPGGAERAGNGLAGRLDPAVDNALAIGSRLNLQVTGDLSRTDLSGQDLSFRRFRRANLSWANLSGALLAGVDLAGADLTGADLTGALLGGADLTGADLTGAKFIRAQLLGAKLAGANVDWSRWDLAALVGVDRTDLADLAQFHAAAVAPPMPVSLGLAPAEAGVPYGFEIGQIPDPVSFHPRGTTLVYGTSDGGLQVCDAATGQPVRTVAGHRARVYGLRHSQDGQVLLTGSADGTARVWDAEDLTVRHVLRDHAGWVWPIELAPGGNLAATGDSTGALRLWDTATGNCEVELRTEAGRIYAAAFRPGRTSIATGDDDGTVRIWDPRTGEIRFEKRTDAGVVFRVRFSPDGRYLASAHQDGTVFEYLVDDEDRCVQPPLRLAGTGRSVYCLRYHPRGDRLATGDTGGTVRLWTLENDPGAGGRQWVGKDWTKHSGAVYGLNFSVDGAHLASADSDGAIRLGDPVTGTVRRELVGHRGSVWPMAFRLDGKLMATSSSDGTHRLWDTETGENVVTHRGHGRRLSLARFDSQGKRIVTSGTDGIVRVWNTRTGRLADRHELPGRQVAAAFYSPEGSVLGAWDNTGDVHVWNGETGEYERQIITDSDHLWTGKFSPDGDVLATAEDDDAVRLRYRTTGRIIGNLVAHKGRVRSIAFSADERWLATGADDRDVRIWDRRDNRCVLILRGHTDRVYSVVFTPDTALLASASNDGSALVWDVSDLARLAQVAEEVQEAGGRTASEPARTPVVLTEPVFTLSRGSGRLWSVAINQSGTLLATAGDDLAVRLWDLHTGRHVSTLLGHTRRVWSVDFSPTEDLLVSSGDDGTALVWDLGDPDAGRAPQVRVTLIGMADGWVAAAPDGRYKLEGEVGTEVWHVIGNCRFPLDSLNEHLPQVRRVPLDADLAGPVS
jgi:WD40 repeat protein